MRNKGKVVAVVLTGGVGRRVRTKDLPKQFCPLNGKPVFIYALELYDGMKAVDEICLVINPDFKGQYKTTLKKYRLSKPVKMVNGGKWRHESIEAAVSAMKDADYFLVHNGVNPTVDALTVQRCLRAAKRHGAAVAATAAFHTVLTVKEDELIGVLDRKKLRYSADPMAFRGDVLRGMLKTAANMGRDRDIPMLELARLKGHAVGVVPTDEKNMKLTYPHDLATLEAVLRR